ncbi:MAG: hypothetical protein MZU97_05785 [Bacillus subtilis]|nr:hypothetical protein [Bacillus subtilis]
MRWPAVTRTWHRSFALVVRDRHSVRTHLDARSRRTLRGSDHPESARPNRSLWHWLNTSPTRKFGIVHSPDAIRIVRANERPANA